MTSSVNPPVDQELNTVLDRFQDGIKTREHDLIASIFTKDAVYQYTGVPRVVGRDAISNFYCNAFNAFPKSEDPDNDMSIKMTTTERVCETATVEDPQMVVEYGTAVGRGPSPRGVGMMTLHQLYTVVYVKEAGQWKIKLAATNVVGDETGKVPEYLIRAMNSDAQNDPEEKEGRIEE